MQEEYESATRFAYFYVSGTLAIQTQQIQSWMQDLPSMLHRSRCVQQLSSYPVACMSSITWTFAHSSHPLSKQRLEKLTLQARRVASPTAQPQA